MIENENFGSTSAAFDSALVHEGKKPGDYPRCLQNRLHLRIIHSLDLFLIQKIPLCTHMVNHLEPGRVKGVFVLVAADVAHGHDLWVGWTEVSLGSIDVGRCWGTAVSGGKIVVKQCMEGRWWVGDSIGGLDGGLGGRLNYASAWVISIMS